MFLLFSTSSSLLALQAKFKLAPTQQSRQSPLRSLHMWSSLRNTKKFLCFMCQLTAQTLRRNQQAAGGLINSRHGSVLAAYPQSDPCGCSSSSADTAALSSCLSCSGSHIAVSPAAPPAPPGTPWRPAWRCAPCPHQRGTGAWSGNVSCTGCSGCTVQRLGRSPEVPSTRAGPALNHTHTHLEGERQIGMRDYTADKAWFVSVWD